MDNKGKPIPTWLFAVDVFRNKAQRDLGSAPLAVNRLEVQITDSVDVTDDGVMKTKAYEKLKTLTSSFIKEGKDVWLDKWQSICHNILLLTLIII